jgi:hypothetical protein
MGTRIKRKGRESAGCEEGQKFQESYLDFDWDWRVEAGQADGRWAKKDGMAVLFFVFKLAGHMTILRVRLILVW